MKQRKILDITDDISLEVKDEVGWLVAEGSAGSVTANLTLDDLRDLRDWLSKEVLLDIHNVPKEEQTAHKTILFRNGPTTNGPFSTNEVVLKETKDLESRRAVVTSGGVVDLSKTSGLITPKDELHIINLSSQIGKAQTAFSKEHINDGGQTGV